MGCCKEVASHVIQGEEMKYPYIKTWRGRILVKVSLDKENETLEWYSLNEIKQILIEQKEERKMK